MATFKAGQRVRIVDPTSIYDGREAVCLWYVGEAQVFNETHGIRRAYSRVWRVRLDDGTDHTPGGRYLAYDASELAPAVDPDEWADAQIAKLKKLGSEPVPLTSKQLDEVRSA